MAVSMMLFTRDLRMTDNPALSAAVRAAPEVVPAFVLDDDLLRRCAAHASRLSFLQDSLADLDHGLREAGAALVIRRGAPWAATVIGLAREAAVTVIHVADDVSGYAQRRLAALERAAAPGADGGGPPSGCRHRAARRGPPRRRPGVPGIHPVLPPLAGGPAAAGRGRPAAITVPAGLAHGRIPALSRADPRPGPRPGRSAAASRPARPGCAPGRRTVSRATTSCTMTWPPTGLPGCRPTCTWAACPRPPSRPGCRAAGSEPFIRQLAWRDFFAQLLADRPDASWRDYRDRGDVWLSDDGALAAWQAGQTGYPVVDAAMRQLGAEGYMHNRARMIVASFLTKDLYLDWRAGAAHFMTLLADGDVASNQLNWQWVAGTGTDTSAHRIFNPTRQGQRFDPGGDYVRRYVPELAGLPAADIHEPAEAARRRCGYPAPLVDHRAAVAEYRARRRASSA